MSVKEVKPRLAELQVQLIGIVSADAQAPNTVAAADMPKFVNLAGPATREKLKGEEYATVTRTYRMLLMVAPYLSGTPGEAEELVEPFLDSVPDFFDARPSLGGLRNVQDAHVTGDTGPSKITYQDQPYIGAEFSLEVVEIVPVVYAPDE